MGRYEIVEQDGKFLVWDYYENCYVAEPTISKERVEEIVKGLNERSKVFWDEKTKDWKEV